MKSKQHKDINGFITVKDNPITKVGVYPYLGREIGAPIANKIYMVYRPAEELQKPETLESFNLLPWVDEHEMLGDGATPAEEKGIQGTLGANAHFDYPYIKNDLRIYTQYLKDLVEQGKIELSPGYRSQYDFTPGIFEGQKYDAIQRNIKGNHLALVSEGRTGKDVAVQDHFFTIDSLNEIIKESNKGQTMFTEEQIAELVKLIQKEVLAALPSADASQEMGIEDEDPPSSPPTDVPEAAEEAQVAVEEVQVAVEAVVQAVEEAQAAVEEVQTVAETESTTESTTDSIKKLKAITDKLSKACKGMPTADSIKKLKEALKELPKQKSIYSNAMDANTVIKQIANRDILIKKLMPHVGVFDSSRFLSAQQVAEYGCKQLNIKAQKGAELATLDGYLQYAKAPIDTIDAKTKTVNSADTASVLWKGKK